MPSFAFLRTWLVSVVVCIPRLALLPIPELMRSRAGSEQLLMIGLCRNWFPKPRVTLPSQSRTNTPAGARDPRLPR